MDDSIGLLFRQSSRGVNHQPVFGFYLIPLFNRVTDAESFIGWTHLLEKVTSRNGLLSIVAGTSVGRTYPKKGKKDRLNKVQKTALKYSS